jgi:hypothetical protein
MCVGAARQAAARPHPRRRLLAEAAEERTLLLPAHFLGRGSAEVQARGDGYESTRWAGFRRVGTDLSARTGRGGT